MEAKIKEKLDIFKEEVKKLQAEEGEKEKKFYKFLDMLSSFLQDVFKVEDDEVTIFVTDKKESLLSFVKPDYLREAGIIPMTSQDSFAVQSLLNAKAKVINHLKKKRPSSIFELVKNPNKPNYPVQKLMVVPLLLKGKKLGVIEILKKAMSSSEAGPDFTEEDLKQLVEIVKEIVTYFSFFRPEDYKPKLTEV